MRDLSKRTAISEIKGTLLYYQYKTFIWEKGL